MCESNNCCQKPEMLKDAPEKCTTEQIRICHGDVRNHPCTNGRQESETSKK
jgi:hypothetical protein